MNTLILGTAFGYEIDNVQVFVESLRRFYDGEVILLVNSRNKAMVQYLRSRRIITIFFDSVYWMFVHVQIGRYVRFGELLRATGRTYDRVLLTDVSDVVFQHHPFAEAPPGELLFFMEREGGTIGQNSSNSAWIEQVFGRETLDRLRDFPISCAGEVIGSHQAVLRYIDLLLSHANPEVLWHYKQNRGHEQGIHNFLLHTGALPNVKTFLNGQHVLTMGTLRAGEYLLAPDGEIHTTDKKKPAIVHQYQYHADALQHVQEAFQRNILHRTPERQIGSS